MDAGMKAAEETLKARLMDDQLPDLPCVEAALSDFISVGIFWCLCEMKRMDGSTTATLDDSLAENTISQCREFADASLWHVENLLCQEQEVSEAYNTLCVRCEHAVEALAACSPELSASSCQWSI
jgi:hypothetical protein